MLFAVDESTGAAVVEYLRNAGYDVLAIGEAMSQVDDEEIISRATDEGRIIITNDKDFGELIFRGGKTHHGVLLLRLHDESPANRIRTVKAVLEQHAASLAGSFTVVSEGVVRIRRVGKSQ